MISGEGLFQANFGTNLANEYNMMENSFCGRQASGNRGHQVTLEFSVPISIFPVVSYFYSFFDIWQALQNEKVGESPPGCGTRSVHDGEGGV